DDLQLLVFQRKVVDVMSTRLDPVTLRIPQLADQNTRYPVLPEDRFENTDEFLAELEQLKEPAPETDLDTWRDYADKLFRLLARADYTDDAHSPSGKRLLNLGRRDFDLLLSFMVDDYTREQHALYKAVVILASEGDRRDAIIDALARAPRLARLIADHGWEEEARETLLELIRYRKSATFAVIRAVSMLNDPDQDDLLFKAFTFNPNDETYDLLAPFPALRKRMDRFIEDMFVSASRVVSDDEFIFRTSNELALRQGNRKAFDSIMEYCRYIGTQSEASFNQHRLLEVLRPVLYLPQWPENAVSYLKENAHRPYTFDPERRVFQFKENGGE
ncbi:MAG: hypothetical protein AAF492_18175, partial [Verrucomicrobiota bacterium]